MNTKFIFLLIFAISVKHTTTIRSYAVNNELTVNEEQVGKDKRSSEDEQCSDDFFITNVKKDLTDYDYRNGNVEPNTDDREADELKNIKKRETEVMTGYVLLILKMDRYDHTFHYQVDIQSFSDADIEQALSKLSEGELEVLGKVMENEAPTVNIKKRGIMENDSGKLCDSRYGCDRKNSDAFDDGNYRPLITFEQLPGKNERFPKIQLSTNIL